MSLSTLNVKELIKPDGGRHRAASVVDAYSWCRELATSHYENFPVASRSRARYTCVST